MFTADGSRQIGVYSDSCDAELTARKSFLKACFPFNRGNRLIWAEII
ncbi:hypothetical protein [Bacillus nakamurai]|nr:hypothetical protein [Bacillus nakamurai]MCC9024364.1 hypothetical protein [Bacillus nakamurai]